MGLVFLMLLIIPLSAKSILVNALFQSGFSNPDHTSTFHIYTKDKNGKKFYFPLFAHTYNQNAWSYNNQSQWVPITDDRMVHVTCTGSFSGNTGGNVTIIGWK